MSAFRRVRRMPGALAGARALWVDAALAVAVALAVDLAISVAGEPGSRPVDAAAYAMGALMGVPVLWRRRWPFGALIATAAVLFAYYATGFPGISPAIPLAVALYSAAAAGRLGWSLVVAALFVATGIGTLVLNRHEPVAVVLAGMVQAAALLAAVALLGEVVRSRRVRLAAAADRLRWLEARQEQRTAHLLAEERLRIARDLHDVLAHTTTAITVQAQVAADALTDSPQQARSALDAIRSAGRDAMVELKATVGVLRTDGDVPKDPAPGLDQLDGLLALVRDAGIQTEAAATGERRPLPAAVERSGYRIVQEALTNVVRHSAATRVTVAVDYGPAELTIEVTDNGSRSPRDANVGRQGNGIAGMTERATALGGSLQAAPSPTGGFRVRATLPAEDAAR